MNDLDFIQKCVNGDSQSWDEFLKRYSRLIYKYILSVFNSKNIPSPDEQISDIFQGIITSLIQDECRKLTSFKGKNGCSLASWLRQVSVNFTIDYLRKAKPAFSLDSENEDGLKPGDILVDNSLSVPELLEQEERLKGLEDCVEELNSQSKLLIELNINQGVRLEALKALFKLSSGAINMQKTRIIVRLRECFKKKGFKLDF